MCSVRKPLEKLLGRSRVTWENNLKMDLRETDDEIGGRWN
jgi:hypothetical protein